MNFSTNSKEKQFYFLWLKTLTWSKRVLFTNKVLSGFASCRARMVKRHPTCEGVKSEFSTITYEQKRPFIQYTIWFDTEKYIIRCGGGEASVRRSHKKILLSAVWQLSSTPFRAEAQLPALLESILVISGIFIGTSWIRTESLEVD